MLPIKGYFRCYIKFIIFFLFALLSGCNNDDDVPVDVPINAFISLEYFEQQVINSVGTEAVGCGKVKINESSFAVNTCVSDSFFIVTPFYAFYIIQASIHVWLAQYQ